MRINDRPSLCTLDKVGEINTTVGKQLQQVSVTRARVPIHETHLGYEENKKEDTG